MTEHWFRPKTHGYGVRPINWKGWVATVAYFAGMLGGSLLMLSPDVHGGPPKTGQIIVWAAMLGIFTAAFVRFCKARTDGEWKWRWGGKT